MRGGSGRIIIFEASVRLGCINLYTYVLGHKYSYQSDNSPMPLTITNSIFLINTAAYFALPSLAILVEGSALTLCVQMTAIPAVSTLSQEVVVKLVSTDGTGKREFANSEIFEPW